MPPLMMVWTNVHGGWILGVGVLVLWIAGGLVDGRCGKDEEPLDLAPLPGDQPLAIGGRGDE